MKGFFQSLGSFGQNFPIPGNRKKVLFAVNNMPAFLEMAFLAEFFKKENLFEPFFYLDRAKGNAENLFISQCQKYGFSYMLGGHALWHLKGQGKKPKKPRVFQNRAVKFFYKIWRKILRENFWEKPKKLWQTSLILRKIKPAAVVLDTAELGASLGLHKELIKIANQKKIPTIIYVSVLLLPHDEIAAFVGEAKYILVSSDFQKDILWKAGVNRNKIFVLGQATDDKLFIFQQEKEKLRKSFLAGGAAEKIILYALPQFIEDKNFPEEQCWDILEKSLEILTKNPKFQVLISLHPRMDRQKYQYLEAKFPAKILDISCSQAIPLADLFISGTVSSMVRVVLLAGCPVLMSNILKIAHSYTEGQGVWESQNLADFEHLFQKITHDNSFCQAIKAKTKIQQNYFGFLDGKNRQRISDFFFNLVNKKSNDYS